MLHITSASFVARDLHTIAPGPLEHMCWRQWGDCKNSRIAPLNAITIIIITIIIIILIAKKNNELFWDTWFWF